MVLKAVVCICTDLGETFYDQDVSLAATLRSPNHDGDIYLRRTVLWTAGMRALPISIDITRSELDWPAKLHVGIKGKHAHLTDHLENFHSPSDMPSILSAWSDPMDPTSGRFEASRRVERQFMPLSERPLSIYEDTGESIARHLWYAQSADICATPSDVLQGRQSRPDRLH